MKNLKKYLQVRQTPDGKFYVDLCEEVTIVKRDWLSGPYKTEADARKTAKDYMVSDYGPLKHKKVIGTLEGVEGRLGKG